MIGGQIRKRGPGHVHGLGLSPPPLAGTRRVRTRLPPARRSVSGAQVNHPRTLREIVENGLCLGCGLCQSVAGPDKVVMDWVEPPGRLRPKILQPLDAATEQAILETCPGTRLDGAGTLERNGPEFRVDPVFGPWIRVWRGHAADPDIHHSGIIGRRPDRSRHPPAGVRQGRFHPAREGRRGAAMRSRRHLSFSRADVLAATGSRYGPVAPLVDFTEQLDKGRPFAVIGKPCDVSGVHNMRRARSARERTGALHAGVFLRHLRRPRLLARDAGAGRFPGRQGWRRQPLRHIRYRGFGCPGPTRAVDKDGTIFDESYSTSGTDRTAGPTSSAARSVADPTGEIADVSIADSWPGGGPTEEEWGGFRLFISRTPAGDALMQDAMDAGVVTVEPKRHRRMYEVQPHQAVKKQRHERQAAGDRGRRPDRCRTSATCGSTKRRRSATRTSTTGTMRAPECVSSRASAVNDLPDSSAADARAVRRRNLRHLLKPSSIAFVGGAGLERGSPTTSRDLGFDGDVWTVNPRRAELGGVACVPTLADLPGVPDAAFIGTSPEVAVEVVRELAAMKVPSAVCYTAGFSEVDDGKLQHELIAAAGTRIWRWSGRTASATSTSSTPCRWRSATTA